MSHRKRWALAAMALGVGGLAAALGLMWRPAIDPIERPMVFEPAQIARGAQVVTAGDCAVCHTRPGGKYLAGGLPLVTPFGTLYSTNITPDAQTGIGKWPLKRSSAPCATGFPAMGISSTRPSPTRITGCSTIRTWRTPMPT